MYLNIEKAAERKGTGVSSRQWWMISMLMGVEMRTGRVWKLGLTYICLWTIGYESGTAKSRQISYLARMKVSPSPLNEANKVRSLIGHLDISRPVNSRRLVLCLVPTSRHTPTTFCSLVRNFHVAI
jgi:hypothetical protein